MGLNLLSLATKFLGGAGASQQPAAIQRTAEETKPASQLEQVNSAMSTNKPTLSNSGEAKISNEDLLRELHERSKRDPSLSLSLLPEVKQGGQIQEATQPAMKVSTNSEGLALKVSQQTINNFSPLIEALTKIFQGVPESFIQGAKEGLAEAALNIAKNSNSNKTVTT